MPKGKRKKSEKSEKATKAKKGKKPKVEEIPDLLAEWPSPGKVIFKPLRIKGRLSPQPIIPSSIGIELYELFSLFIPEDLYGIILTHTNLYATLHWAGEDGSQAWKPTVPGNIKIFFAAIFYMGAWGGLPIEAFRHPDKVVYKWL